MLLIRGFVLVSTHSRLKAAGIQAVVMRVIRLGFNTQPPEGGWARRRACSARIWAFQHTAA